MSSGLPEEWGEEPEAPYLMRVSALYFSGVSAGIDPPPKAAMEAREFIHVRLHEYKKHSFLD